MKEESRWTPTEREKVEFDPKQSQGLSLHNGDRRSRKPRTAQNATK